MRYLVVALLAVVALLVTLAVFRRQPAVAAPDEEGDGAVTVVPPTGRAATDRTRHALRIVEAAP